MSSSISGSASSTPNSQTYEAARARRFTDRQPDKIHWDGSAAFREEPYRQLHHQDGIIGHFSVRLLEASDLKRSYWSLMALGPVKHLGLSKAHGDVSSYCTFSLGFHEHPRQYNLSNSEVCCGDKKPAAMPNKQQQHNFSECRSSPVVERNNNPVWDNCVIDFPLRKGAAPSDGMRVHLNVRVDEEATAVESFIPGIIPISNQGDRLLGVGQLDLTELLLGETTDGNPVPGIRDEWIPIALKQNQEDRHIEQIMYNDNDPLAPPAASFPQKPSSSFDSNSDINNPSAGNASFRSESDVGAVTITGMVRVLVSYQPNGLEPEKNDVVALESFGRRNTATSSCRPLLDPLQPLTVLDRRGPYLLCEYSLPSFINGNLHQGHHQTSNGSKVRKKARVRLHRNAVFVIERQNLLDAAHNLALLPVDVALATPLGQAACNALAPVVSAGTELLMPSVLALKLLWMATRTTAVASMSGVQALTSTLWREGSSSLLQNHNQQQFQKGSSSAGGGGDRHRQLFAGQPGTSQFIQL